MSSRSPRQVSADLAAANAALDVCAALLRAQGDESPEPAPAPEAAEPTPDPQLEKHRARLDELAAAMSALTTRYEGADVAGMAARAVAEYANKVFDAKRASLSTEPKPKAATPPPKTVERDYATQRALRAALDRYFSYFEMPGTSWRLDWSLLDASGMPSATATSKSPGNIEGTFSIALPDEAPWRTPTKLVAIEPSPGKTVAVVSTGSKPVAPSKYFVVGLSWSAGAGSVTLSRSKKKLSHPVRVSYPGDGTVSVEALDASGRPSGPPAAQSGETSAYLDAVWWKMCASAMGLIHSRGDAVTLTFDGANAETLASPANMADAIMTANESLLAKINDEIDEDMRAKLSSKFDTVPARYRSRVKGLKLASGSNPPSFDAKPASAKPASQKPAPAKPASAKPASAKPAPAKPMVAKPEPTKPAAPLVAQGSSRMRAVEATPVPMKPAKSSTSEQATVVERKPARPVEVAADEGETTVNAKAVPPREKPKSFSGAKAHKAMPSLRSKPTPMADKRIRVPAVDVSSPMSTVELDEEPTKVSARGGVVSAYGSAYGSGPIPNPASASMFRGPMPGMPKPRTVVSRPSDEGERMFGQNTIDEKFESLDLEIDWDDEDADESLNDQTLPGVTPSVRRATTVTIQN